MEKKIGSLKNRVIPGIAPGGSGSGSAGKVGIRFFLCEMNRGFRIKCGMTRGITLVEIILSITIIGMFSTLAVVNFRSSKQDDILRIAAFRAADAVRAAQSYALAGVPENADSAIASAQMFGVHIASIGSDNIGEAVIFADTYTPVGGVAGTYEEGSGQDKEIRKISLDSDNRKSVKLNDIKIDTISGISPVAISFKKPDASGFINGNTDKKEIVLTFKHVQSGRTRTVTINRVTGRVDAQF